MSMIHLPNDKVLLTWEQLEDVIATRPREALVLAEEYHLRNSLYTVEHKKLIGLIDDLLNLTKHLTLYILNLQEGKPVSPLGRN